MTLLRPIILYEDDYTINDIENLRTTQKVHKEKDIYIDQLGEVFEITNPKSLFLSNFNELKASYVKENARNASLRGNWIYLPWSCTLIHCIGQNQYYKLRTNRNKNLLSEGDQQKLYNFTIGYAGLSVGSNIASNFAYMGGGNCLKVSDYDTLDTTNLNRVKARLDQVGDTKIDILSQQIFDIDPYADIYTFSKGLTEKNIDEFFDGKKPLDLVFEIIDDFKMKIQLRIAAKKRKIPLIMLTNLGDSVLIDIERYDQDVNLEIFNGKIRNLEERILNESISKEDEKEIALSIVGMDNIPNDVIKSVQEIGVSLTGRPQLGSTVAISAGIGAYFARLIALGKHLESGRRLVKFKDFFQT